MPSYINILNNLTAGLSVATTVSPNLSSRDWGVDSSNAGSGETARILWMNRDEGIPDGGHLDLHYDVHVCALTSSCRSH